MIRTSDTDADVIILNHNGIEHLGVCLRSVLDQRGAAFTTTVVDNGSTDGSIEYVAREFPAVRVLPLGANLGFAAAVNRGIHATSSGYVALLNNDIELDRDWLGRMIAGLAADPRAGAASCKMLNFFERDLIDAAGDMLTPSGVAVPRGMGEKDRGQYDKAGYGFGACAGAAVYRRMLFDAIGMFDEDFFMCEEDVDLDFRMHLGGWRIVYVPTAVCYHKRGATVRTMSRLMARLIARNSIFVMIKDVPGRILLRKGAAMLGAQAVNWVRLSRGGNLAAVARGLLEVFVHAPGMFLKRRKIQSGRTVSLKQIETLFGNSRDIREEMN